MGGTDDPSNLIELTVEEHAEAHKKLYEKHNLEWDRIAWLSLSGQINMSEAKRLVQKEARKRGGDIARANRNANGTSIGDWNKLTGHVKSIATPESCKKGGSVSGRKHVESGQWKKVQSLGGKIGGKIANKILQAQRWKCLDCGLISTAGGIGNHHRGSGHTNREQICQQ